MRASTRSQPTWTLIRGQHSFRSGGDFRVYREESFPSVHSAGRYDFARASANLFTKQLDNSSAAAIGQDLAAMLLGLPSGGLIDRSTTRFNQVIYGGVFFQDDWKVNNKLTLNLGLRWELEGAPTERDNRNVRGWDPTADARDHFGGPGRLRGCADPRGPAERSSASAAV